MKIPNPRWKEELKTKDDVGLDVKASEDQLAVLLGTHEVTFKRGDTQEKIRACFDLIHKIMEDRMLMVTLVVEGKPQVLDYCRADEVHLVEQASQMSGLDELGIGTFATWSPVDPDCHRGGLALCDWKHPVVLHVDSWTGTNDREIPFDWTAAEGLFSASTENNETESERRLGPLMWMGPENLQIAISTTNRLGFEGVEQVALIRQLVNSPMPGDVAVMTVLEDYKIISGSCFYPDLCEPTLDWLSSDIRRSACSDFYGYILHEKHEIDVDPKLLDSQNEFEDRSIILFDVDLAEWQLRPLDSDRFDQKIRSPAILDRVFAGFLDPAIPPKHVEDLTRRFCLYWKIPYRMPFNVVE